MCPLSVGPAAGAGTDDSPIVEEQRPFQEPAAPIRQSNQIVKIQLAGEEGNASMPVFVNPILEFTPGAVLMRFRSI